MTTAAAGRLCLLAALLPLAVPLEHGHREETDTYHVSVGHLFLLSSFADSGATWERGGGSNTSLPAGVEVRDGRLWFLPVDESHEGEYTCKRSNRPKSAKRKFRLSLSHGDCPDPSEVLSLPMGSSGGLPCKQTEIFRLNTTRNVRWMKDCHPVQPEDQIIVSEDGFMRFSPSSLKDSGKYTCLIDISLNGKKYTAARSIQLTVKNEPPDFFPELHILKPQEAVIPVQVGMSAELQCLAMVGLSEDPEVIMFWTVNTTLTEDYEELSESWKFISNRGVIYGQSTLSISKVLPEFLNVSIQCHVGSPVEERTGRAWLREVDRSFLYTYVAVFITVFVVILLLPAIIFFRVDLILGYRTLMAQFYKKVVISDGKLYDAYVSFLQPKSPSVAEEAEFALQTLPEELERQQGYSLYIRGRDDCPGEAMHEAITATLRQSRRLIIILSSEGRSHEPSHQCEDQRQLLYERTLGLHDALMMNEPKVILVEMDGPVDYRLLPESLQYIKRQQGALKWRKAFLRKNSLSSWLSNRHFWKNLRYRMPSVPARRHRTVACPQ